MITVIKMRPSWRKVCLAFMLGLLFSHMAWCNSPEAAERYTRGFKLYQYHLENGISVADDPIPPAELGAFVAKRSEYKYREAMIMIGMPASPGRMFRAVGYLNVTQPSSYTIIVASEEDDVYGSIFANKKKAISGQKNPFVLTAPVHFSEPGKYEIDMRIYTNVDRELVISERTFCSRNARFKFLIKTPDSDVPLPAHKVLLLPLE